MRSTKRLASLVGVVALAISVSAGAGVAQAAKVSRSAPGGAIPDATGGGALAVTQGTFTQEFRLGGKKVNKKQIFDVSLQMSAFGSLPGANSDLRATLRGPRGEKAFLNLPNRTSFILEFDDRSGNTMFCNPFVVIAIDCLYATGVDPAVPGSGGFAGSIDTVNFNSVYRGKNPKGTWTLNVWDTSPTETNILGTSTLEVKTVRKFAKEGK